MIINKRREFILTIDEFLTSNKNSCELDRDYILKVKYNDNIDYIFKTDYGKLDFDKSLKCVGLFNKSNKKLYGSSFDFNSSYNKDSMSNFYSGTIGQIKIDLYKGADKLLNNYIKDNLKTLKEMAKDSFDKFISSKEDYESIKKEAVNKYIYHSDNNQIEFNISSSKYEQSNDMHDLIMKALENPEETIYNVFEEYI